MRGCFLEDLTWDEAEKQFAAGRPVLVPVGAFAKEHGLHLPLKTDSVIARHLAKSFVDHGVRRLAVLNTGYSTEAPLRLAARAVLEKRGVSVAIADLRQLGQRSRARLRQSGGGHADEHETSLMLAIEPAAVRHERALRVEERARADTAPWTQPGMLSRDPNHPDYSPSGATGDPALANAQLGREFLEEMVSELINGLRRLYPDLD
jgi:creatinine amidohydrolase